MHGEGVRQRESALWAPLGSSVIRTPSLYLCPNASTNSPRGGAIVDKP